MVYKRTRITKTTFNRLPLGAAFWDSDNTAVAPFVKLSRTGYASAFSTDHMTETAASPLNFTVTRVPKFFFEMT